MFLECFFAFAHFLSIFRVNLRHSEARRIWIDAWINHSPIFRFFWCDWVVISDDSFEVVRGLLHDDFFLSSRLFGVGWRKLLLSPNDKIVSVLSIGRGLHSAPSHATSSSCNTLKLFTLVWSLNVILNKPRNQGLVLNLGFVLPVLKPACIKHPSVEVLCI